MIINEADTAFMVSTDRNFYIIPQLICLGDSTCRELGIIRGQLCATANLKGDNFKHTNLWSSSSSVIVAYDMLVVGAVVGSQYLTGFFTTPESPDFSWP